MATPYCPFCKSTKPMMKSGWQLRVGGKPPKQRYQCTNKGCYRMTVHPRWRPPRGRKPKAEKEKS